MVTKFHYDIVPVITSIQRSTNVVIDFDAAEEARADVESAVNVFGSFSSEEDARIIKLSDTKWRAFVPVSTNLRFYRIRTE